MLLTTETLNSEMINYPPNFVSVAYIGIDWQEFIDPNKIKKIIISPTIGSNPFAIESLVNEISWEKVYFLNNLHAKIYIGANNAIVGSPNLSRNGLTTTGQQEAAIKTKDKTIISDLLKYFNKLEELANKNYPDTKAKKKRLSELKIEWTNAVRSGVIKDDRKKTNQFSDYNIVSCDDFYISWYQDDDDFKYTENVLPIKELIEDELHIAEDDEVEKGKWILAWKITTQDRPYKDKKYASWIYIDEIISQGIESTSDYKYTKLALMLKNKEELTPPFEITKDFYKAFSELVVDKKYLKYMIGDKKTYYIKNTFGMFEEFLIALKERMNQNKTSH
ncbi:hypothetical protein FCL47_23495 [Desulfopila sp. IMCC35006]|uniref:phospholipase D family protein n=1 Tax=Desulfopila sp. IMCC35006 TaxID=2569542 RepID=UPI0010AD8888|nr:phospholipase D family protein [Desulfopila sp. IMCC35006]TKB23180.1 hypothetical protein FCL47_23495 [Desulfopila sp. IMCC35006]